jgi:hypothetical protein
MGDLAALHRIFDELIELSSPSRAERTLKQGIAALVASGPRGELEDRIGGPINPVGSPVIPAMQENALWSELRPALRAAVLPADTARRQQIAAELLIAPRTLINICARSSLSWALTTRIAAWLEKPQPPKAAVPPPNGRVYQLSQAQRDRLDFLLRHTTNVGFREQFGVGVDLATRAAEGEHLPPDILARLVEALG